MKHLESALNGQNQFWRYFVMFLAVAFGAQMIGSIPLGIVMLLNAFGKKSSPDEIMSMSANPLDFNAMGIPSWLGLALLLFVFAAMLVAFAFLVKPIHNRTFTETINGRHKIRWNRVWMGMLVWGAISAIALVVMLKTASPDEYEINFNIGKFIPLLLVVLILIPFQTSCEEVLFRGYLSQAVGAWTKSRWWVLAIVSVLFGLMHVANPEVKEFGFWISMPQYILFGLFFGLISILDDGIELALGIHFINNAFLALFVTHEASALQTDAVVKIFTINPKEDLVSMAIFVTVATLIFWRIYKWDFRILNKKIEPLAPPVPQQIAPAMPFETPTEN